MTPKAGNEINFNNYRYNLIELKTILKIFEKMEDDIHGERTMEDYVNSWRYGVFI